MSFHDQQMAPGTHDTMAISGGISNDIAQTQSHGLKYQLCMGIRVLDIRLKLDEKNILNKYIGVDISKEMFKYAEENLKNISEKN